MFFRRKKDQKPYPRSFGKRLTWRIMITLFIVMSIVSVILVFAGCVMAYTSVSVICQMQLDYKAATVEKTLTEVYVATVNAVPDIESNLDNPGKLQAIMKRVVELNPHVRSSGISFRENYYPEKGTQFCPYAMRSDSDSMIVTRTIGDSDNYLHAEWFTEALKAKEGYWSKPFFSGKSGDTPLVAYLMPIRDRRDSTVAVLGVDMSLENLSRYVSSRFNDDQDETWSADWKIYFFVVDTTGTFLVHPDKQHIIHQNFFKKVKETPDTTDDMFVSMISKRGQEGRPFSQVSEMDVTIEGEEVFASFVTLDHTPWTMVFVLPENLIEVLGYVVGGFFLFFILIGLIVVFFTGRRGIKKVSRPLQQLATSADEVAKGNFNAQLPDIKSRDEIHQLRDSFENMQRSLNTYVEELRETTALKASMESELKIAHDIQMDMLPKTFPPYPERDDVDIYGSLTPAKAVGGDLFDFFIRNNQLFFCVGDVSGKGIPASLFMAVTRSLFRNISAHVAAPEHILLALNKALADNNDANMFVTLFIGVLDLETGHLHYCNAGHNSPLLVGQGVSELPCLPNLPLGIMGEFDFEAQETDIAPGTTIFLFTDGLNEAENARHEQFGDQRIAEIATRVLDRHEHQPVNIIYEMYQAVQGFVAGAEQSDDLTMLAIQYKRGEK